MRVFAGPNASGKTTIFKGILAEENIQLGVYINADEIGENFNHSQSLNFSNYQLTVFDDQIKNFFRNSSFSPLKRHEPDLCDKLSVIGNSLKYPQTWTLTWQPT